MTRISTGDVHATVKMPLSEPIDTGPLHARFRVFFPSGGELPDGATIFTLRATDNFSPDQVTIGVEPDGSAFLNVGTDVFRRSADPGVVLTDEWQCFELALDVVDTETGTATLSVDGNPVVTVDSAQTAPPSGPYFVATIFGEAAGDTGALEMTVDDVVVATSPIGCD